MPIKFALDKNNFLNALGSLQNITSKKGTMAVLANILFNADKNIIELIGTDLEVGIKIKVEGEVFDKGSITLPSKKLYEIVRQAGSEYIEIEEKENNWVRIKTGTSTYNLAGISSDEYPKFPEYDEENLSEIESELIEELIEKTIFSVAQERESNFTLTGILLEKEDENKKIRLISSDGHRLTIMEKESKVDLEKIKIDKNIIIPKKGIVEIRKFCEGNEKILIGIDKKQIIFKKDNGLIIVRLMNGDFPDYRNILNVIDKENYLEIEKNEFLESLKRTSIFTDETFNSIQLDIKKNKIILTSSNIDIGNAKDEIKIKYKGSSLSLGFNCRYLIDTLSTINGDVIKAYINSDQSPCLIESDDDKGFSSIIMPMKI